MGDDCANIIRQLQALLSPTLGDGIDRGLLQSLLPPGGARNALDSALWDLEAKKTGRRAWEIAGLPGNHLTTALTIGLDDAEVMGRKAGELRDYSILKLKLDGNDDLARVAAVHENHPAARIIVDPNQSWSFAKLEDLAPELARMQVELIEQPLPIGEDEELRDFRSPVPLCADESCQTSTCLPSLVGKYDYVNIKLDKTGGLTEGLKLADAALRSGFKLMVGCMGGSSLSMAPAFVVGQLCDFVDLDGPLLLKSDCPAPIHYRGSEMSPPSAELWG
jgi:L-alanine-DL-glutamate epimerase-like enolase superfamily enzyme